MPCYDPGFPFDSKADASAREAARLLCAMCKHAPNYSSIPPPILAWYYEHRKIDLERIRYQVKTNETTDQINAELDVVRRVLEAQR